MRTIILIILAFILASCATSDRMPTPDDKDREMGWHVASVHDKELTERLLMFLMQEQVGGPIAPVCSDDGVTCCTFSGGDWCCCSFTLGCRCHIQTP